MKEAALFGWKKHELLKTIGETKGGGQTRDLYGSHRSHRSYQSSTKYSHQTSINSNRYNGHKYVLVSRLRVHCPRVTSLKHFCYICGLGFPG